MVVHCQFPELFHHPRQELYIHETASSISLASQPLVTSVLLSPVWICPFWCLLYMESRSIMFLRLMHVITYIVPFYGWMIFYCVYMPYFAYPFLYWWTLVLFLLFIYCESCCSEHWCTSTCLESLFSFLGTYLAVELQDLW